MTVVVTNDVPMRTRGFLASCMLEISPGVYTAPRMKRAVRERVWKVVAEWHRHQRQGSVLMTFSARDAPGGQQVLAVGVPQKLLLEHDGVILCCRPNVVDL